MVSSDDLYLLGKTEVVFTPLREVNVEGFAIDRLTDGILTVTWSSDSQDPVVWTVECSNDAGTVEMVETAECSASFAGIELGTEYLVELAAPGLFKRVELIVPAGLIYVDSFTAEMQSDGLLLRWTSAMDNDLWQLVRSAEGSEAMTEVLELTGTEVLLTDLLPGTNYSFSLRAGGGRTLVGQSSVEYSTSAAPRMNFRGVDPDKSALALFPTPAQEDWTLSDLPHSVTSVKQGDKITFVLTCAAKRGTGNVNMLYIVRNEAGAPVASGTGSYVWNQLWVFNSGKQYSFMESLDNLPTEAGTYTLELYFSVAGTTVQSYQLAGVSAPFTVE